MIDYKLFILFAVLFSIPSQAQTVDIAINTGLVEPDSDCNLAQESLTAYLYNNSAFPFNGNVEVGYTINNGSPVTNSVFFSSGSPTWIYTFPTPIDFSACQSYDLAIWVYEPTDINNGNDTAYFQIFSDCNSEDAIIELTDSCFTNGDSLFLTNYNGNITAWEESTDNGTSWTTTSTSNDWHIPTNTAPILIRTIVDSPFGICGSDTLMFYIPFDNFYTGVDAGIDVTIFISDTIQLNGTGGTNFSWYPDFNMNDSTLSNPQVWPNVSTLYFLESSYGVCVGLDSVLITVIDNSQIDTYTNHDLIIPNLLTPFEPNWEIIGIENYPNNTLLIFTLNGQLVYSAEPYVNNLNSAFLVSGTYIYQIRLEGGNGVVRDKLTVVH